MSNDDRQNLKRALLVLMDGQPQTWRDAVTVLKAKLGDDVVASLMKLPIACVFELTFGDLSEFDLKE